MNLDLIFATSIEHGITENIVVRSYFVVIGNENM